MCLIIVYKKKIKCKYLVIKKQQQQRTSTHRIRNKDSKKNNQVICVVAADAVVPLAKQTKKIHTQICFNQPNFHVLTMQK